VICLVRREISLVYRSLKLIGERRDTIRTRKEREGIARDVVSWRCGKPHKPSVEEVDDWTPPVIDRPMALVGDDEIERTRRELGMEVLHCLQRRDVEMLTRVEVS
jgi:hypothetical protein